MLAFAVGRFDLEGEVGGVRQGKHALGEGPVLDAFAGQRPSAHRRLDAPEGLRHVAGDLHVTVHDHRQGRGLHAAYGQAAVVGDRVGAGGVHADQPVGLGPRVGGVAQPLVVGLRPHAVPRVADGLLVQRGDPQTQGWFVDAGVLHDAAEDGLALAVGIARVDEFVDVGTAGEGDELTVALVGAFLAVNPPSPRLGADGQRFHAPVRVGPCLALVCVGHGEVHEMALRP